MDYEKRGSVAEDPSPRIAAMGNRLPDCDVRYSVFVAAAGIHIDALLFYDDSPAACYLFMGYL